MSRLRDGGAQGGMRCSGVCLGHDRCRCCVCIPAFMSCSCQVRLYGIAIAWVKLTSPSRSPPALPSPLVVRNYILATMTERHVERHPGVAAGKPRVNATKDRKGYRVFRGSAYLGFAREKKQAEKFARDRAFPCAQKPSQSLRAYKYVAQKTTKHRTVYYGVTRVQGTKQRWTKKYMSHGVSPRRKQPKL